MNPDQRPVANDILSRESPTLDPRLLIAEDDALVARSLASYFQPALSVAVVSHVADALRLLGVPGGWCGAVIDIELPGGSGFDILEAFRGVNPFAPVVILTGYFSPELINRAAAWGAVYSVKPAAAATLTSFRQHLEAYEGGVRRKLDAVIDEYAQSKALTVSERRILSLAARGISRKGLAEELGVAENTVKTHVRSLLRKCDDAEQIGEVVREIWRKASVL